MTQFKKIRIVRFGAKELTKLFLFRALPHRVAQTVCALAVFALTAASPHAFGGKPATVVYPTGSFPLDVDNVQAAIDAGGTVILKATNSAGQPTAFNFGPPVVTGSGVNLTTDVAILGESVGQYVSTIRGGLIPILGFVPIKSTIQGIDFESPMIDSIVLAASTGADIIGNRIRGVVPGPLCNPPCTLTETEGMLISGFNDPQHAVTGRIRVANNIIEFSAGDFATGMQFDAVAADIEITGNTAHFLQTNGLIFNVGILVVRAGSHVNVANNTVTMGPGDPDVFPIGIYVEGDDAEARYMISGNTVMTENPSADGMDVVGDLSRPIHGAMITNNHIVMQSLIPTSGGIALFGAVEDSIVSSNTIEGMNGSAIQILGLDGASVADSNHAVGNDISRNSPLVSDIFFGPFSTNNLVAGQCATYVDEGVGNRITCGTAVSPFAATTQAAGGVPVSKSKARPMDIRRAILDTIQSRTSR